ncbi:hypothetical protein N7454_000650 [Penicillium verhagenii]|nr:hypothetical protein N7454_000650 [Penicillium verhagenii]
MPGVPTSKGCEACRKAKKKVRSPSPRPAHWTVPLTYEISVMNCNPAPDVPGFDCHVSEAACGVPNDTLTTRFISTLEIRDMLLQRHWCLRIHISGNAPAVFVKFGKALKELCECLNDPVIARSPNTLCAIYLIAICQRSSHAEAIAHIIRITDMNEYRSGFARNLLVTLCVPVILEGMRDPRIRMDKRFWDQIASLLNQSPPPPEHSSIPRPSISLFSLAKFPEYIHNPSPYISEITSFYLQLKTDTHRMHSYQNCGLLSTLPSVHQSRYQAAYIVISSLALLLNTVLHSFNTPDAMLIRDADLFIQTIIEGADVASRDRPLGAAHVPLCLIVALAAAKDPQQITCIENILTDHQSDFKALEWKNCTKWLKTVLENHRLHGQLPGVVFEVDTSELGVPGGCAMM